MLSPRLLLHLRRRSTASPIPLCRLSSARHMGGGPRTFPGGINKWQWKRLHEKKAKEKEKKLLLQEKQVYEARIRSEIRSKLAGLPYAPSTSAFTHTPLSSKDHIKVLADRFLKDGAEDLWNSDDGPTDPPPPRPQRPRAERPPTLNLRKLVADARNSASLGSDEDIKREGLGGVDTGSEPSGFTATCGVLNPREMGFSCRNLSTFARRDYSCFGHGVLSNLKEIGFGAYAGRDDSLNGSDCRMKLAVRNILHSQLDVFTENSHPLESREMGFDGHSYGAFARGDYTLDGLGGLEVKGNVLNSIRTELNGGCFGTFAQRNYSVEARRRSGSRFKSKPRWGSSSDNDGSDGDEESVMVGGGNSRFRMFSFGQPEEEDTDSDSSVRVLRKSLMNNAALRNYDRKVERRPPKNVEEESGSFEDIQRIREELKGRMSDGNAERPREESSLLSQKRFDECNISPLTIKALSSAGYVQMTVVQESTLSACLEGKDVLLKAKTGTGKSAAFLLPAIESVLQAASSNVNQCVLPILVLVLCPTRELACQIAAEANVMLKYHAGIGVQTLIGGTRFKFDQKRLESDPCQIMVATPGRLLDHIENSSGFSLRLMGLKLLILDEADHLLALGFRKDIEKIVDCVPRNRQSLLFSATIPKEVRRISQLVLKRDHAYIDTVGVGGLETHAKVRQSYLIAPHIQHFQMVYQLLKDHIAQTLDYKVIVFCTTAMVTSLMFLLLRELKMNVREIHSRKPQLYRTRISDEFRESKRLILVTSDVSARGMDYPDVTLVIQVGIPPDREQYIHRLGRTGREGKDGEGMLVLAPWEEFFLDDIKDLPVERIFCPKLDPEIAMKLEDSMSRVDASVKEATYHAWLGYYNSIREIGRDKTTLVELANQFCESIGLQKPPSLFRKTANKMGLREIPGIRIRK